MDTLGKRLLVDGDMSGNLTSEVLALDNMMHYSVHAIWTGAPNGTLFIDISGELGEPTNWAQLATVAVAGAGQQIWMDRNAPYKWVRLRYVNAGGTGTLTIHSIAKGDK